MIGGMSNDLAPHFQERKILEMALTMDDAEIADATGLPIADVKRMTATISSGKIHWVRCNKTGRYFESRTWRGAYLRVCILGLTDWECGEK